MKIHILSYSNHGVKIDLSRLQHYESDRWQASRETMARFRSFGHEVTTGGVCAPNETELLVLDTCVCDRCCFVSLGMLLLLLSRSYRPFRSPQQRLTCELPPILIYRREAKGNEENQLIFGSIADSCSNWALKRALKKAARQRIPKWPGSIFDSEEPDKTGMGGDGTLWH